MDEEVSAQEPVRKQGLIKLLSSAFSICSCGSSCPCSRAESIGLMAQEMDIEH